MKNTLVKISLANVLVAAVLLSLSCSDVPQNKTVVNTPANNTIAVNNEKPANDILTENCDGDKKQKVKDGMTAKINSYDGLKYQLKKRFDFEPVVQSNGDVVLYIWGNVFTDAKNLPQLNKTYEGFVKKGCVTKVVFDKAPEKTELNPGFDYELCEDPNQVCSNGTCQQNCPKETDNENANTNSNASKAN